MYDLSIVIDRICAECKKIGISVNRMLIDSKAGKSLVDNMKKGKNPSIDRIFLVAQYLNITSDYLLGLSDNPKQSIDITNNSEPYARNEQIKKLLDNYDKMNDKGQTELVRFSRYMLENPDNLKAGSKDNKIVS